MLHVPTTFYRIIPEDTARLYFHSRPMPFTQGDDVKVRVSLKKVAF